ncbi:MAG: hypothetical protein EB078_06890 [Proteobacteria bacterium]|nr:hypothetical protein [Pseudomonadota bacterium]
MLLKNSKSASLKKDSSPVGWIDELITATTRTDRFIPLVMLLRELNKCSKSDHDSPRIGTATPKENSVLICVRNSARTSGSA